MTLSADSPRRSDALDPTRSFIVEAPAGSGKTELLTQRFLGLLSRVERPEQVVAITFTRKAAAEMRQRIVETLQKAAAGVDDTEVPPHRRQSLTHARAALAQANRQGWSLLDQPRRINVMTIDSLNFSLAQRMPLLANGIGGLTVADEAETLYTLAARRTTESLADAGPVGEALRRLLAAADNSLSELERWLAAMLPRRDRWLRELTAGPSASLTETLVANLERLRAERLGALRRLISPGDESSLIALVRKTHPDAVPAADAGTGEGASTRAAERAWRVAARLFLTRDGNWRRRFTRRDGIEADDAALREHLDRLSAVLHGIEGLRESLFAFGEVPDSPPAGEGLQRLEAIEAVWPRLLAELRILFAEQARVDHTEVAMAALQALGAVDRPSELLLALDRRIEHLLVDEFQDTSHLQWRLLELLTAGWQAGDGRTLFLVGDPMQSIYRFRDADLSLFLDAAREGIGGVRLERLALTENHRSAPEIVDWVNARFAGIFPSRDAAGFPAYRRARSRGEADGGAGVTLHLFRGEAYEAEIARCIRIIRDERKASPGQSIGILVRSRSHLAGLRGALAHAGLDAQAIEIDSLTDTQPGQDLIGLASALAHPGDRLGWLGVLRSPWCGLSWTDLLALGRDRSGRTIRELLCDPEILGRLSPAGRERAGWLAARLEQGFALRPSRAFGRWIRDCWLLIDGPAALAGTEELELAERFFAELDRLARGGDIDDPAALRVHFGSPRPGSAVPGQQGIEIVTMHRAKGLEFDTVILPGLGRVPRGKQYNLINIQDFHLESGERFSLIAAAPPTADPLLDYLQSVEREHDAAERARLLYVAATRARRRLHLIGSVDERRGLPRARSLLATLWPTLGDERSIAAGAESAVKPPAAFATRQLRFLAAGADVPLPDVAQMPDSSPGRRPDFEWVHPASVQVGTLIHRELKRLADAADKAGEPVRPRTDAARYRRELALLGVAPADLDEAASRVAEALGRVWDDAVGRWILRPWPEAWSERRLTLRRHDRLEHVQLDRSFVDEAGHRWIIDYKTGRHLGSDVEGFLATEVERYRDQLERYAAAVAAIDSRPIRVGLYFPLMTRLKELAAEAVAG